MFGQTYQIGMMFLCCTLSLTATPANAVEGETPEKRVLDNLLAAVQQNNYQAFLQDAAPQVKASLTKRMFSGVAAQFAARMQQGYELTYFGSLKQQGCEVHLWKITYRQGQDDTLAKLALTEGQVAGFWLQ